MSQNVVVIQFDDAAEASAALKAIRDQHKENQIHLNDTAIITKDAQGKVHKVNEVSSATEIGAVAGGSLGLLLMFLFPIAGIAVGAASGAAIGALLGKGVDGKWVKEVTESLKPGTSALFLVFDQLTPSACARWSRIRATCCRRPCPTTSSTSCGKRFTTARRRVRARGRSFPISGTVGAQLSIT